MPRLNIWIPERESLTIDTYCKSKGYNRSVFLWKAALHLINSSSMDKSNISCDYCKSNSVGKFKVTVYDSSQGEISSTKYLCKLHFASAKREGNVSSVE